MSPIFPEIDRYFYRLDYFSFSVFPFFDFPTAKLLPVLNLASMACFKFNKSEVDPSAGLVELPKNFVLQSPKGTRSR
ncbi:MAG: hypothetical protein D6728_04350 [Cyanobacteria bacterium J055]|nr:MAG: hypothetical protein D6728_04350 [Cyanobacteria bacterium J055]